MIQVEGLTKYYGAFKAVDDLSFTAERGEILGFLGPNGAGKTTTMRILTGYMPPTEGQVVVAGYDMLEQPLEARRHVGYLPESVPLYREMTVWQYVEYMADLYGINRKERMDRVGQALEQVDLLDRAESMVSNLSKGMRQRVGLAQALVHQPDVLILDEPTIGLDPAQIREVRELIRQVGQDRTVMLSTHILSEVEQMCSRVLVINKGQIVAEDAPQALSSRLQNINRYRVSVGGGLDFATISDALSGIDGVTEVLATETGAIDVLAVAGIDPRPQLASTVVGHNWDLLELRALDMTLEDIFLQLVRDEEAEVVEEIG